MRGRCTEVEGDVGKVQRDLEGIAERQRNVDGLALDAGVVRVHLQFRSGRDKAILLLAEGGVAAGSEKAKIRKSLGKVEGYGQATSGIGGRHVVTALCSESQSIDNIDNGRKQCCTKDYSLPFRATKP